MSYSDGTSILNAIYANTGITTYYGQTPGLFADFNEYDRKQFVSHLIDGAVIFEKLRKHFNQFLGGVIIYATGTLLSMKRLEGRFEKLDL